MRFFPTAWGDFDFFQRYLLSFLSFHRNGECHEAVHSEDVITVAVGLFYVMIVDVDNRIFSRKLEPI